MRLVAKVQKLGRIAIPQTLREYYDIEEGDLLEVELLRIKKQNGMIFDLPKAQAREVEA